MSSNFGGATTERAEKTLHVNTGTNKEVYCRDIWRKVLFIAELWYLGWDQQSKILASFSGRRHTENWPLPCLEKLFSPISFSQIRLETHNPGSRGEERRVPRSRLEARSTRGQNRHNLQREIRHKCPSHLRAGNHYNLHIHRDVVFNVMNPGSLMHSKYH